MNGCCYKSKHHQKAHLDKDYTDFFIWMDWYVLRDPIGVKDEIARRLF